MPRHLPQDTFNGIAIGCALTKLVGKQGDEPFLDLIRTYKALYPDEDVQTLITDAQLASLDAEEVCEKICEALFAPFHLREENEKWEARYSVLIRLQRIIGEEADKTKPFWRRILGGARFNYENRPLPERIRKCQEDVNKAGMVLLARQLSEFDREWAKEFAKLKRDWLGR
jgi:hypothetical protein